MKCYICNEEIQADREEALKVLDTPHQLWTCLLHADNSRIKGVYLGESGVSPLVLARHVSDEPVKFEEINQNQIEELEEE